MSSKEARLSPQISRQQRVSVGQGKENENQGQESVKISTAEEDICRKNQNVEAQSRIACTFTDSSGLESCTEKKNMVNGGT